MCSRRQPQRTPPHLMLDHLGRDLREIVHLMRALDAHVPGGGQIRAAGAPARRTMAPSFSSGFCIHGSQRPCAPGCLPRFRRGPLPLCRLPPRLPRPGSNSSLDGGRDEFPELRETIRSSRARRRPSSRVLFPQGPDLPVPGGARCAPGNEQRPMGRNGHHDQHILTMIKPTR